MGTLYFYILTETFQTMNDDDDVYLLMSYKFAFISAICGTTLAVGVITCKMRHIRGLCMVQKE